ncbi:SGNH/GDSL hydrolase family protein [Radiobacillus sp. PE A8.2]|uniref:SGNH/GDSL hydrolase family protein n=1 Tax=Radiobacillus sp. PE A8.2 TaxID=3380349 RepID=UPI00388CFAA8
MRQRNTTLLFTFLVIMIVGLFILLRPYNLFDNESTHQEEEQSNQQGETDNPLESTAVFNQVSAEDQQSTAPVAKITDNNMNLSIKEDLNIVAIGDSLTEGIGDESNGEGYVGILEQTLKTSSENVTITNYGVQGNRTDNLLERLDRNIIIDSIKDADIVLITIGANDIMKVAQDNILNLEYEPFEKEQVHFKDRMRSIMDNIASKNPDAIIYLIGFYNPFEQYFGYIKELDLIVNSWNATEQSIANEFDNAYFIATKDLFEDRDDLLATDNFHPNKAGYQLMADRILNKIQPSIIVME